MLEERVEPKGMCVTCDVCVCMYILGKKCRSIRSYCIPFEIAWLSSDSVVFIFGVVGL